MKTNKSVRVPSLDPQTLNKDLLTGVTGISQGAEGWAFRRIENYLRTAFEMDDNPLQTLRRLLPQWHWSMQEVENASGGGEAGWCAVAQDKILCTWFFVTNDRTFTVTATRPKAGVGFACRTAGGNVHQPQWVLVNGPEKIGVEGDWNTQVTSGSSEPHTFRHFAGLIPDGTRPVPVEQIGETRSWEEGSPYNSGQWGRCGYETHYRMPDGSTATRSVTTDEW